MQGLPTQGLPIQGLAAERIASGVEEAGLSALAAGIPERFSEYYGLLQRWNSKLNLTSIRDPEDALRRHFVECIFCAQRLPPGIATLLDYGSGAGFPGIPIALCRPEIRVTLAESQGKKASFLREAVRSLGIVAEVYGGRVEEMAADWNFDTVTLRAVDKMQEAVKSAAIRVGDGGWLVLLVSSGSFELPEGFSGKGMAVPGSDNGLLVLASHSGVPRGTSL
jgi:16S rRNA (guanine527-N7)-methyltransferase